MSDLKDYAQVGILGLLGSIITVLFALRGANKVKHDNAKADRDSRFEENLQKRYEAAMARNSELQEELRRERDGKALLERKVVERDWKIENLLETIAEIDPEARTRIERWARPSQLADFDPDPRPTQPRERKR